jgi:cell division protein FtsI/penicillin-binding protein 2
MTRRGFLAMAAAVRDESVGRVAERELPTGTEYILLRTSDESAIASRWNDLRTAAPLGSLVKPFLALAYGAAHRFSYPEMECLGCWLARGHGRIGITTALAQSCNSYFLQLSRLTAVEEVERVAQKYGLPMPGSAAAESLIGRFGNWRARPANTAMAYSELGHRRAEPGVSMVFDAMRRCAQTGTAARSGAKVAAKTGTAPCVHSPTMPGDGLMVALFPEDAPAFVLLARAHGVPGAECARRVGPFLRAVLR